MSNKHLTEQKFVQFSLATTLQQGLQDAGFEYCTPIQAACLPAALEGKDVAGQAQTGTGKTVAFLLACCHYLVTHSASPQRQLNQPRALILAPTRELAIQIHQDAKILSRHTDFTLGLVYGGTAYEQQKTMLAAGVDILIGTPGRLIDFFKQGLYDLKCTEVAVLDEADRMFDLGFINDLRFLLRRMPPAKNRLNLLFSATLSFKVMELAYEHMNNPKEIKIESDSVVLDKITEYIFYPADEEKLPLLVNLLKRDTHARILVFVNTRHAAQRVSDTLAANGIKNGALSGDVPQDKREQLLAEFKAGKHKALVATDVAARGLHIPQVSHVYNFDLPQDADDYIHRIGRTARAGASGEAISFVCERYAYSIMDIEATIGHALPRKDIDPLWLQEIKTISAPHRNRKDASNSTRGRASTPRSNPNSASVGSRPAPPKPSSSSPSQAPPGNGRNATETHIRNVETTVETAVATAANNQSKPSAPAKRSPNPQPLAPHRAAPVKQPFSRRYGEIPAIG